nr:immunoglobulin heavy chain junction region [Mus musculus]
CARSYYGSSYYFDYW